MRACCHHLPAVRLSATALIPYFHVGPDLDHPLEFRSTFNLSVLKTDILNLRPKSEITKTTSSAKLIPTPGPLPRYERLPYNERPCAVGKTITMLVARDIPSSHLLYSAQHSLAMGFLQAYQRSFSQRDFAVLRESAASRVPSLGLVKNQFGDLMMNPNSETVHGFHAPHPMPVSRAHLGYTKEWG